MLKANINCCEEASLWSKDSYIPCNAPAVSIVGWKGRNDAPIRMCSMCADHNIKNRGGEFIQPFWPSQPTEAVTQWPIGSAESLEKDFPTPPTNPLDAKSEDDLLLMWDEIKKAIEVAKEQEMELRKYIVGRAFPQKHEGMNTKELGNGYQLKAAVKYNYNLAENDTVEAGLDKIACMGNHGAFIADRLVSWKPNFLLTEYRQLCEDKDKGNKEAEEVLKVVNTFLTITEAAPALEIKEPKAKKK